jgi:hypothetical protein
MAKLNNDYGIAKEGLTPYTSVQVLLGSRPIMHGYYFSLPFLNFLRAIKATVELPMKVAVQ